MRVCVCVCVCIYRVVVVLENYVLVVLNAVYRLNSTAHITSGKDGKCYSGFSPLLWRFDGCLFVLCYKLSFRRSVPFQLCHSAMESCIRCKETVTPRQHALL